MTVLSTSRASFHSDIDVVIVGAGGCGLTAAISARQSGADVVVLERDTTALGSTAMSTGLIPAAGTRSQSDRGIDDTPDLFFADIMNKTRGKTDASIVRHLVDQAAPTLDWLVDQQGVPLSVVDSFDYPGHSRRRLHGTPNRSGSELMAALHHAAQQLDVDMLTDATVTHVFADQDSRVRGVGIQRPDGTTEDIGCGALVLACCGFAGNPQLVARYLPEMGDAVVYGHPGNKGDALLWGKSLGAAVADLHAYQGHGAVAASYGVSIMWAHITEGGFQVNLAGERFCDESRGYSEQAVDIAAQPEHVAWSVYDETIHQQLQEYQDYRDAHATGCVRRATDLEGLCEITGLPDAVKSTVQDVERMVAGDIADPYGRDFTLHGALRPPYRAVKVSGALFHTQGGLVVDEDGRVQRTSGGGFANLFAGGGAARGISGPSCGGYMSGNGLLTATTLGRLAGAAAARTVRG